MEDSLDLRNLQISTQTELAEKIAVGYNRYQVARLIKSEPTAPALPFLVFTDWLTYSVKLHCTDPLFYPTPDWDFVLLPHNGRSFKNLVEVYYKNEKFAILSYGGYGAISNFSGQLQIENSFLYGDQQTLRQNIFWLSKEIGFEIETVSRLDIAIDFPEDSPLFPRASSVVSDLYAGRLLLAGREKDFNVYSHVKNGALCVTGLSLGKRSSSRFLRFYNKSNELETKPKDYIQKFHTMLNPSCPVWRLEVQLNGSFWNQIKESGKELALWGERYLNIVQIALDGFFSFHLNQGKSETNKNDTIDLINWPKVHDLKPNQWETITKKARNVVNDPIKKAQRAIKANFREYVKDQTEILPLMTLGLYAHKYALYNWLDLKISQWIFDLDRQKKEYQSGFNWPQFQDDIGKILILYPRVGKQYEKIQSDYTINQFENDQSPIYPYTSPNIDSYTLPPLLL